jgi:hypothetical protein
MLLHPIDLLLIVKNLFNNASGSILPGAWCLRRSGALFIKTAPIRETSAKFFIIGIREF